MDLVASKSFIQGLDLSGTPLNVVPLAAADDAGEVFSEAKRQARVVGAGLFSFAQGVDAEVREAISDSALLAQLVANKRTSVVSDPIAWFAAYTEVLQNVGWALQDTGFIDYTNDGNAAEVNEKVVEVLSVALGPTRAALALITDTMKALKAMNKNGPWITLFSRESQKATISRFQVGLVEKGSQADVFVSLLACLIQAQNTITQVLFFKYREAHASFKAGSQKVSINRAALKDLGPTIRAKVRRYEVDYLSSIADI